MAIRLKNKGAHIPESAEYPYGDIKDDDGSGNGTPVNREVHADFHQFFARMMGKAIEQATDGFDYNDVPDNAYEGFQFYEALLRTRPYKVYTASLTQTGTNPPVAVIMGDNTIGTIVWSRTTAGSYLGTLVGAFTSNKTWIGITGISLDGTTPALVRLGRGTADQLVLRTYDITATSADDIIAANPAYVEIRVYF